MSVLLAQLLRIAANCPDVRQAGPLMEKAADRIEKYRRELNTRTFLMGEDGRMMASLLERKQELETERDALRAELATIKGQEPVAFYWQDIGYPEPRTHGPHFGQPSEAALRNVDGRAIPVLLYILPPGTPAQEVPDHFRGVTQMAEQGGRQEVWARQCDLDESDPALFVSRERVEESGYTVRLTTATQPGPCVQGLVEALNFACKSLCHVTSSDGSGHADIALSVLRMAGVDGDERERLVEGWKASCQWRIDKAHRQAQRPA